MEELVYDYLCINCQGKKKLVKNEKLREIFFIGSDKSMRKIIQNIRKSRKFPMVVGSVSGTNGGFYICITDEEIIETINNIRHRANEMLRMSYILKRKAGIDARKKF